MMGALLLRMDMNRILMGQLATPPPFSVDPRNSYLHIPVIQRRLDIQPMRTALAPRVSFAHIFDQAHIEYALVPPRRKYSSHS